MSQTSGMLPLLLLLLSISMVRAACSSGIGLWRAVGDRTIDELLTAANIIHSNYAEVERLNPGKDLRKLTPGTVYAVPFNPASKPVPPAIWSEDCPPYFDFNDGSTTLPLRAASGATTSALTESRLHERAPDSSISPSTETHPQSSRIVGLDMTALLKQPSSTVTATTSSASYTPDERRYCYDDYGIDNVLGEEVWDHNARLFCERYAGRDISSFRPLVTSFKHPDKLLALQIEVILREGCSYDESRLVKEACISAMSSISKCKIFLPT